jgi:hypothetical protein
MNSKKGKKKEEGGGEQRRNMHKKRIKQNVSPKGRGKGNEGRKHLLPF